MERLNKNKFEKEFRLKEAQLEKKQNYEKKLKQLKEHQKDLMQYKKFKREEQMQVRLVFII